MMAEQMMQGAADKTIPAGYKQTEVGVIPQDWNVSMLRDISSKITDGTHDTPKPVIEGIPFLTAIHVKDGKIDFDGCYFLPESIHNEIYRRCNPEFGDILMVNIGSGTATTAVVNVDYEFSLKNVALIKPNKENNGFYINYALSFSKNKIIDTILTGGAQPFLSLTQIALLQVPVPSREEQTTIANVLSDSDALIGALEQLIAKKQAIKTATMQQLLTGRTRLPQFALRPDGTPKGYKSSELGQIPEDWESVDFGNIAKPSASRINPKMSGGGDICIELEHISSGTGTLLGETTTNRTSSLKSIFEPGDVLFGKLRAYLKKYILADFYGVCSTEVWVLKSDVNLATSEYIYSIVQSERFINAASEAYGTHMPRADWSVVKYFPVMLPSTVEQTAIATILSDMDSELTALQQKLAKARSLKQGMMQQLLTGRIRLPLPQEA
ncbi:restriction endonuclease subunit S [Aeromonas caviae]|uniref:Restriction endonuclease subunit S n=1 Tax=Aeromonas veronii TaxID=654 RepID=A0AAW5MJT1_AERVE|nr:restriction endonuclease subunit S [Aeromonas veronii]MCR4451052.1 restriction endonuclease subunit S [Aeromonas veronii]WKS83332.1 restriction endonuclease subunit S [Aeromonas caviae]